MIRAYVLAAIAVSSFALAACAGHEQQLRTRAAFDFQCTESELRLTKLDSRTQGVEGCGKRGTYVLSCPNAGQTFGPGCTWILNTDAQPSEKAAQSSAPATAAGR